MAWTECSVVPTWGGFTTCPPSEVGTLETCSTFPAMIELLCEMESIWHSELTDDPSGVPSSKYARRYHAPSQPCSSMLPRSRPASRVYLSTLLTSPRGRASSTKCISTWYRKKASQTLSPLP